MPDNIDLGFTMDFSGIDWGSFGGFGSGGFGGGEDSGLSAIDMAGMTPEELAEHFGRGVEGFDVDEFMKRFGQFMTPFDDTKVNLLQEGFQIGSQALGSQVNQARGGIRSNMALSAGAEEQRGFVLADYTSRMRNLGVGLKQDVLGEYERYQSETVDFFRQLAEREIFTADYWEKANKEKALEHGAATGFGSGFSFGGIF